MTKDKITYGFRLKHIFVTRPILKFITLVISVMIWFYVKVKIHSTGL